MVNKREISYENHATPEYSFEEGLDVSLKKILSLLENRQYIVVGFSTSGINVGKTKLAKALIEKLHQQNIPAVSYHSPEDAIELGIPEILKKYYQKDKIVIILDQASWGSSNLDCYDQEKQDYDNAVTKDLEKLGIKVDGVDFWIGIYRPDIPFVLESPLKKPAKPIADLIIRNDLAHDK